MTTREERKTVQTLVVRVSAQIRKGEGELAAYFPQHDLSDNAHSSAGSAESYQSIQEAILIKS
jgi:hypothetical protein